MLSFLFGLGGGYVHKCPMGGLNEAAFGWYYLGIIVYCLLVATWGVYPDVVLGFPCFVYAVVF